MIRVLSSGISTTIQDLGRFGYRKYGVPLAGSMDQASAIQANLILRNDRNLAVLEMLVKGPQIHFEEACWVCITGATILATCDGTSVPMFKPFYVEANQQFNLGRITEGRYSYMAVKGGILSEEVMGSLSHSNGITAIHSIQKDTRIEHRSTQLRQDLLPLKDQFLSGHVKSNDFSGTIILVEKGPEFDALSLENQKTLLTTSFQISNESNRMGYRLESAVELSAKEIITSPVQPGTVQMTSSGQLIVLMRDAQTTGGYARVLQLSARSVNGISQKVVGEPIKFRFT
ncbi:MAG: biotin-dependent carboxyltransferase family protein [Crocinitomicaceae bacterium]|nr:biotin-dependent carboxyltransferase family protein [Crocinitomicaceae bacterium]